MSRNAIKPKTDITEITKRVAEKLGCKPTDVNKEIGYFWIDVDSVFTNNCGYNIYVEHFGTFWLYTKGVYGIARNIEKRIIQKLTLASKLKRINMEGKAKAIMEDVAELMTRLIFLDYAINEYKDDVLKRYPNKYKITNEKNYKALIDRMVKLFKVQIHEFPITINNPIQEMYLRKLRRKGLLRNPVIRNIKTYRGKFKKPESTEM